MTTLALLSAAVATAVVGICEFTQVRALQYRVWSLERRRDQIERNAQRVGAAARARRTARSILAAPPNMPTSGTPLRPVHLLPSHGERPADRQAQDGAPAFSVDRAEANPAPADDGAPNTRRADPAVHRAGGAR